MIRAAGTGESQRLRQLKRVEMVDGHKNRHYGIPWALPTVLPGPRLTQLDRDSYKLEYITAEKQNRYLIINGYDFHVLGKFQLGEMIANSQ